APPNRSAIGNCAPSADVGYRREPSACCSLRTFMTAQNKPIELYSSATPNGRKITIMLEELGVPYNMNYIRISRGEQFRPDFLAISPNNKIPAIVDPEGPGGKPISIFES